MTRNERKLKAIESEMSRYSDEIKQIWAKADEEDRETTPAERGEVEVLLKTVETLKGERSEAESAIEVEQQIADVTRTLGKADVAVVSEPAPPLRTFGEQFVESEGYKSLIAQGLGGERWSTGQIALETKGTLLTTPGTALTPPQYQPGVVETLFQRLTVADLLAQGVTTAPIIRYVTESTATSGADAVAEAAAKPESTLAFAEVSEPVRKLATFLPVSDEMLEDAPQIQSYINDRLSLFVKIKEEQQILSGTGTAPQIQGILGRAGINTWARGTVDDNATAIFKGANGTRGSSFLDPDAVIVNPANWQAIRLGKDNQGQFYGGGPFYGPYGGPQGPASANFTMADNLWGMRVVVTSAIGAGTALVGAFQQGAQLFRRSGLTVEASNSHVDFFQRNLTAIRAEERLAVAVYRPAAFVTVTGLN